jgi:sarcosine oxidase subunit beta
VLRRARRSSAAARPRRRRAACARSSRDALNIAIAQRSLARYKDFGPAPAGRSTCTRSATCSCSPARGRRAFERSIALQNEHGVPSRLIGAEEAQRLCPLLEVDDVLAAAYSPEDGTRRRRPSSRATRTARGARRAPGDRLRGAAIASRGGEISAVARRADDPHEHRDLRGRRLVAARAASSPASSSRHAAARARSCSPSRWTTCRSSCR